MAVRRPPGFNIPLNFYDGPEVNSIPKRIRAAAIGVWGLAGNYAATQLTDGYVGPELLKMFGCTDAIRAALMVTINKKGELSPLWIDARNGGVQLTNWPKHQRTNEEVTTYRASEAERKRTARAARKDGAASDTQDGTDTYLDNSHDGTTAYLTGTYAEDMADVSADNESRVDLVSSPTSINGETSGRTTGGQNADVRPDHRNPKTETETETETSTAVALVGGSGGKDTRGTRLPDNWTPTPDVIAQMRSDHPHVNLRAEHSKFIDYWQAKAGKDARKTNWDATWRNWIRRAAEQTPRNNHPTNNHQSTIDHNVTTWLHMQTPETPTEITT